MQQPDRQPPGRPVGGQYAARTHGEGPALASLYPEAGSPEWALGQVQHWSSPVIGWIRRDAAYEGLGLTQERIEELRGRLAEAAAAIRPDRAEEAAAVLLERLMPAAEAAGADPHGFSADAFKQLTAAAAAAALAL